MTLQRSEQDNPPAPSPSTVHHHDTSVWRQASTSQPFIKNPRPALLLTHTGRLHPGESLLFTLITQKLITHCSTFQIAESGRGGKNAVKATASKHGLSRTVMNGLEEACVYSGSIIKCWLADSRQDGYGHSLAGIRPPFPLSGRGLSPCPCHSALVSVSRI